MTTFDPPLNFAFRLTARLSPGQSVTLRVSPHMAGRLSGLLAEFGTPQIHAVDGPAHMRLLMSAVMEAFEAGRYELDPLMPVEEVMVTPE